MLLSMLLVAGSVWSDQVGPERSDGAIEPGTYGLIPRDAVHRAWPDRLVVGQSAMWSGGPVERMAKVLPDPFNARTG